MSDIRDIVAKLAQGLGMELLVKREGEPDTLFNFRIPAMRAWLDLDEQLLAMDPVTRAEAMFSFLYRSLIGVQRNLFRHAIDHIAKFDREPLDRLRQLEAAARQLLDAMGAPGFCGGAVSAAWFGVDAILRAKPGAVSWAKDGYGKDPT